MKIVINTCYGGFGLSEKAMKEYFRIKGWSLYIDKDNNYTIYWKVPVEERVKKIDWNKSTQEERIAYNKKYSEQTFYEGDVARNDKDLILAIETVGIEKSGDKYSELKIVEVPDDVEWTIEEYDGMERIAEKHRTWE